MRLPCTALAVALLATAVTPVLAQHSVSGDLQQQMTPAEFRAAGLDKLSADELAALNSWLRDKVQQQTQGVLEQAKEEGRLEVVSKTRDFFDFDSHEPIESTLVGKFDGFGKGRRFVLANGQEWEQTESAILLGVHLQAPPVRIKRGVAGVWYLQVGRYNTQAKVRRIK